MWKYLYAAIVGDNTSFPGRVTGLRTLSTFQVSNFPNWKLALWSSLVGPVFCFCVWMLQSRQRSQDLPASDLPGSILVGTCSSVAVCLTPGMYLFGQSLYKASTQESVFGPGIADDSSREWYGGNFLLLPWMCNFCSPLPAGVEHSSRAQISLLLDDHSRCLWFVESWFAFHGRQILFLKPVLLFN